MTRLDFITFFPFMDVQQVFFIHLCFIGDHCFTGNGFQAMEKLLSDLKNCMILNNASRSYCIKVCPKCGSKTPNWTRGGRANSGKQMLVCHSCNHRTVVD